MLATRTIRRLRATLLRVVSLLALSALLLINSGGFLSSALVQPDLRDARSVLWVVAHPDDESFFFAPSILGLQKASSPPDVALLCLSVGNHDGLGQQRRQELSLSCSALGIPDERCDVIDLPSLPDSPHVWWTTEDVAKAVKDYVQRWEVDAVISFDLYGVSGHANHRALSSALRSTLTTDLQFPATFAVHSTGVLAKFTALLLLPLAVLQQLLHITLDSSASSSLFINTWRDYLQTRRSFAAHKSQTRWFRTLFVSFSRYLWFVRLDRVFPSL